LNAPSIRGNSPIRKDKAYQKQHFTKNLPIKSLLTYLSFSTLPILLIQLGLDLEKSTYEMLNKRLLKRPEKLFSLEENV